MYGELHDIRCLSVRQPHALAIVLGRKKVENRSWPTDYRGLLLIHASTSRADLDDTFLDGDKVPKNKLHFGAVIGAVNLFACVSLVERPGLVRQDGVRVPPTLTPHLEYEESHVPKKFLAKRLQQLPDDPYACGPYCFLLRDPLRFDTPIPAKGQVGLFKADEVLKKIGVG